MNLRQIEAFVRIANNKSFSRTAKEMYLTQPTVSASISNLESELGVQLFMRATKGAELTDEGRKLYLYARQMVELSDTIKMLFKVTGARKPMQQIVISASTIPSQYLLPGILGEFKRRYPSVQIRLYETDSQGVTNDVLMHQSDIGFVGAEMETRGCDYIPFYSDELVIVMPNTEKYRAIAREKSDSPDWILDEPFILREGGSGTRAETIYFLKKKGIQLEDLNVVANLENPSTVLLSVENGIGISIISKIAAESAVRDGKVLVLPLKTDGFHRYISVVTNNMRPLTSESSKLIKVVRDLYGERPGTEVVGEPDGKTGKDGEQDQDPGRS